MSLTVRAIRPVKPHRFSINIPTIRTVGITAVPEHALSRLKRMTNIRTVLQFCNARLKLTIVFVGSA